jgi:hypothetical protein
MEDFYFYTIVIALIILIVMLTMIGIILSYGNETKVYPPIQNEAPDYWSKASADEFGANDAAIADDGINLPAGTVQTNFFKVPIGQTNPGNSNFQNGSIVNTEYWTVADNTANKKKPANCGGITGVKITKSGNENYYIQFIGNDAEWTAAYPGLTVRCAKQKWALDRGIVWDGVTNFNGCTVVDETKTTKTTIK